MLKSRGIKLKYVNLIVSILAAIIMVIGDIYPLIFETGIGVILFILDGMAGGVGGNESTARALAIMVPVFLILIISGCVVVLAIVAAVMAEKKRVKTYIALNVVISVITLVAIACEIRIALWHYDLKPQAAIPYFLWAVATGVCMAAGMVLTGLTVKKNMNQ